MLSKALQRARLQLKGKWAAYDAHFGHARVLQLSRYFKALIMLQNRSNHDVESPMDLSARGSMRETS